MKNVNPLFVVHWWGGQNRRKENMSKKPRAPHPLRAWPGAHPWTRAPLRATGRCLRVPSRDSFYFLFNVDALPSVPQKTLLFYWYSSPYNGTGQLLIFLCVEDFFHSQKKRDIEWPWMNIFSSLKGALGNHSFFCVSRFLFLIPKKRDTMSALEWIIYWENVISYAWQREIMKTKRFPVDLTCLWDAKKIVIKYPKRINVVVLVSCVYNNHVKCLYIALFCSCRWVYTQHRKRHQNSDLWMKHTSKLGFENLRVSAPHFSVIADES